MREHNAKFRGLALRRVIEENRADINIERCSECQRPIPSTRIVSAKTCSQACYVRRQKRRAVEAYHQKKKEAAS